MSRGVEFGKKWEGQTVDGRFPLQRYLGGSTSSAVFQTQHRGGKAAIKIRQVSAQHREAQLAQWRKAAELSHPNLVRIFEVGRCWLAGSELVFVVSECAEENLSEVLPRRALSIAESEELVRPALDVLRFLHQRGFVHGRLRPSNVMSVAEQLKLSSDSIRAGGKSERPAEISVYDAPEVREGTLSSAGDVWSLGVTVAEALTQKLPTTASDVLGADLPQPFADIVQHCLRQNPIQRWTPREIGARLQGQSTPHYSGTPEISVSAAPPRVASRRMPIVIAAGVLIVLAAIYALVHLASNRPERAATPATTASQPAATTSTLGISPANANANSPGTVLNRVLPNPSVSARNTIHGKIKVRVKVDVDSSGNVAGAKFVTVGPSKYFSRLAMEAARQWKFKPPTAKGQPSRSEWTLLFEFTRGGTEAVPQESR